MRQTLGEIVAARGCAVELRADGEEAIAALREEPFDIVFVDYRMPKVDGIGVLQEVVGLYPDAAVVLITGEGSEMVARDAFKIGAFDYITKPFHRLEDVEIVLDQALERQRLRRENGALRRENLYLKQRVDRRGCQDIVGNAETMRSVYDLIDRVASTRSTVLITGESGVGKELIARALHRQSDRVERPFVSVNCGALPDTLLEDELFGHVKGAFTDAVSDRMGRFELADKGTLFLDEIATMSQNLQVKLLRVLQEREITPLGSTRRTMVDVRIIAATNNELRRMIDDGTFRKDLFYRLNVIHITLPPLRDRRADIPLLAAHFLEKYCEEMGLPLKAFSPSALRLMMKASWPGNVRQLENLVERAVALSAERTVLDAEDLPEDLFGGERPAMIPVVTVAGDGLHLDTAVSDFEERLVIQALENTDWVKTRAARLLNIKRTTLIEKMKRLGIPLKNSRVNRAL